MESIVIKNTFTMMSNMRTEVLKPINFSQWNTFVDQSAQGDVFCYSWWLEAITKSHFKILVIFEKDEIVAGIPIAYDSQNKVNEPPLTRTLGVLYKTQESLSEHSQISNQRKWLGALLEQLPPDDFVQMCMHHNFTDWLPFRWKGFNQKTRYTYIIDYHNKTINDLWKKLNRGRKESINRAFNNGIIIEHTDDFDMLYEFENLSYERQGMKFRIPRNDLKPLDDAIKKNGNRIIFKTIDKSNKVHAMLYVVYTSKSAYALLSGSDPKLRKLGGHTLVMWEAIKFFIDKTGYFNFGGSDIEHIENHLRGFGGSITPYFHIYNENFAGKGNDFWYHLSQIWLHLREVRKICFNKLLKYFKLR
jgi:hypothetical protein